MADSVKLAVFGTWMAAMSWRAYLSLPVAPSDWAVLSLALALMATGAAVASWLPGPRPGFVSEQRSAILEPENAGEK